MDNPCNLCQFFEKTGKEKNQEMKAEVNLASLSGRLPYTKGGVVASQKIVGFCTLRKMYIGEGMMNKPTCKERATIQSV